MICSTWIIDFQLIPTNDAAGNICRLQKDYLQVNDEIKTIPIPLTSSQNHHHFNWPHVAPDLNRPVAQSDEKNSKRFIKFFNCDVWKTEGKLSENSNKKFHVSVSKMILWRKLLSYFSNKISIYNIWMSLVFHFSSTIFWGWYEK